MRNNSKNTTGFIQSYSGKDKSSQKGQWKWDIIDKGILWGMWSGILEYGANAGDNTYVFYGSLDEPDTLPPKGEFFCKYRAQWMPEVPGLFHKNEIKE